ncbi:MAG: DoxX family protein [Phycisphaerales bacterium]
MSSNTALNKPATIISWILQILVAVILGQTLFFKLTGAPETIALFEVVGAEPMGRYGSAIVELIAVVLLLVPKTSVMGAVLSLGVITGAIGSHFTKLGISIDSVALAKPDIAPLDGPSLFVMAVIVFVSSLIVIILRRAQLPVIGKKFVAQG